MSSTRIKEMTMSFAYGEREAAARDLLGQEHKADRSKLLLKVKESDNVSLSVFKNSLRYFVLTSKDMILELDEVRTAGTFWKDAVFSIDQVATF